MSTQASDDRAAELARTYTKPDLVRMDRRCLAYVTGLLFFDPDSPTGINKNFDRVGIAECVEILRFLLEMGFCYAIACPHGGNHEVRIWRKDDVGRDREVFYAERNAVNAIAKAAILAIQLPLPAPLSELTGWRKWIDFQSAYEATAPTHRFQDAVLGVAGAFGKVAEWCVVTLLGYTITGPIIFLWGYPSLWARLIRESLSKPKPEATP